MKEAIPLIVNVPVNPRGFVVVYVNNILGLTIVIYKSKTKQL